MKKTTQPQQMSALVPEPDEGAGPRPLIKCGELPLSNCAGVSGAGTIPAGSRDAMHRAGVFGSSTVGFSGRASNWRGRNKPRGS
jgi:hypothetical protein